jgi:DNA-binding transcriptional regulator GbsR (MarR family)
MVGSATSAFRAAAGTPDGASNGEESLSAEQIRLAFADAWGQMGAAWGVPPSVARVHGYLMARGGILTERDVREALGLSHRAASIALTETEGWGLVERVPDPKRSGRRGPSATAYRVAGDRWRWFQQIAEQRKLREADPLLPMIERCLALADEATRTSPSDLEVAHLRDWLTDLLGFMHLFDRAVSLLSRADTREIARGFTVLARLPDESIDRLLRLFSSLPEDDLTATLEAISRVSPGVARTILKTAGRVARLGR